MEMNIQKFRALSETVRLGSFTKAARSLNYSQSGISRMIADLEKDWKVTLLERSRSGVALSGDGVRLMPHIEAVCADFERLESEVAAINGFSSGTIRIGTISSVATHWLPGVIKNFEENYPEVDYKLRMGDYTEIESWVAAGTVDCGFIARKPHDPTLSFEELRQDELFAILPKDHELAAKETIDVKDLCTEPFLLLKQGTDDETGMVFEGTGLEPDIFFETWDDYVIMSMVESGLGLAVLPALILKRHPYRLAVKHLTHRKYRTIYVVHRQPQVLSKVCSEFLRYL
ncbi:MAG: LysR family transcriptional regulator [Atopobiaceae bacterium]|jgi:DNA-binding transcriptional LysR family regulator